MKRGNVAVLIVLLVIAATGLFVLLWKQRGWFESKPVKIEQNQVIKSQTSTSPSPTLSTNIEDLISYELPKGWIKKGIIWNGDINVSSPDFKTSEAFGVETGVNIFIRRGILKLGENSLDIFSNNQPSLTNVKSVTVDGILGKSGNIDYEAHSLIYRVQKGEYFWEFIFFSKNIQAEEKYRKDIDEFMRSINFK